jgi:hypothetical protein
MNSKQWMDYTNAELIQAEEARQARNEGRARVCARRAAGHIIEEYLYRKKIQFPNKSAYARIKYLADQPDITPKSREVLKHLTIRATPDHTLPIEADLIADVRVLALELLGEKLQG